ncbi:hypothetical protein [Akkermansia muciniphila]|uniref:Uncharacterized protein n=1 Tax=Akkermansia muciniphila TaxID=239935 RepID=A0AAP8NMU0_9BACT|nr:hypothetical protein [Akkermansia muciniphila]PNC57681.1 hypothetical protein CXU09_01015 [Akkermansia muciniphila]
MGPEKFTNADYRMMLWESRLRRKKGYVPPEPEPTPRKLTWSELREDQRRAIVRGEYVSCWSGTGRPANGHDNGRQNWRKSRKG